MVPRVVAAIASALVLLAAGCADTTGRDDRGGPPVTRDSRHLTGEVVAPGQGCREDTWFHEGDEVAVRDGSGGLMGVGELSDPDEVATPDERLCVHDFTVEDLPAADLYELSLPGPHDDPFTFTAGRLRSADWVLTMRFVLQGGELRASP
jgi:hypothetical protein